VGSERAGTLRARLHRDSRAPGCDASAAPAGHLTVVATWLCGAVFGLVGGLVGVAISSWCVCGVLVADRVRAPGAAGLPSRSAEAAGGVKRSPSGPSAASSKQSS
jgi:hypothetical protein